MECSILNDGNASWFVVVFILIVVIFLEAFEDFLGDDFDIKSFSANVLQTKLVTDYLQHLNELIRTLDAEIKQQVDFRDDEFKISINETFVFVQVSSNAPILFRQASSIGTIEDVLENMQTRIASLKSTVDRISSKITEPYNKILVRKYQLTRLQVRHASSSSFPRLIISNEFHFDDH